MTTTIQVGRYAVEVTRPDKPLFPDGTTKHDLAAYYRLAAARMLGELTSRPVAMERYPDGVDGERVFQKQAPGYFPEWITTVTVPKQDGTLEHVVVDKTATLVYLAGQACLTPHAFLSRVDRLDHPDQIIFDLDPPDRARFPDARRAALLLRGLLADELGLVCFAKSTGSKGLHVHVPLVRDQPFDTVRALARDAAEVLASRNPDLVTVEQRRDQRGDRVYIDVMRNSFAQTAVAPYAVRAVPGAPVAAPLSWDEVADPQLRPDLVTMHTIEARLAEADPWAGMRRRARRLDTPRRRVAAAGDNALLHGTRAC